MKFWLVVALNLSAARGQHVPAEPAPPWGNRCLGSGLAPSTLAAFPSGMFRMYCFSQTNCPGLISEKSLSRIAEPV